MHLYELYDIDSHSHIGIRSIFLKKILELDRATQNQLSWCALLLDRKKKNITKHTSYFTQPFRKAFSSIFKAKKKMGGCNNLWWPVCELRMIVATSRPRYLFIQTEKEPTENAIRITKTSEPWKPIRFPPASKSVSLKHTRLCSHDRSDGDGKFAGVPRFSRFLASHGSSGSALASTAYHQGGKAWNQKGGCCGLEGDRQEFRSYREIDLFHVEPNFTWSGRRW